MVRSFLKMKKIGAHGMRNPFGIRNPVPGSLDVAGFPDYGPVSTTVSPEPPVTVMEGPPVPCESNSRR
jgi:hypothetical protein